MINTILIYACFCESAKISLGIIMSDMIYDIILCSHDRIPVMGYLSQPAPTQPPAQNV